MEKVTKKRREGNNHQHQEVDNQQRTQINKEKQD
jgi:hypothetical protein